MNVIDKIIDEIDFHLNGEMFCDRKPNLKYDKYYGMTIVLTQTEALFLKNILQDIKKILLTNL